jgi:hypothetical protein
MNEYGDIRYKNAADVMAGNAGISMSISLLNQILILSFIWMQRERDWRYLNHHTCQILRRNHPR